MSDDAAPTAVSESLDDAPTGADPSRATRRRRVRAVVLTLAVLLVLALPLLVV